MRLALLAGSVLAVSAAGCASQSSLPLRHVVVYRNGVAYFERAGHVDTDEVRFRMHRERVGDFLATLAVVERGGSSVRAAALPTRRDDERADDPAPKTVVLSLDGKSHDLQVGYITEAPMWKPSYRLVVRDSGRAELQAWGVVQNLSGEDWRDVRLSLAGGAPIAFASSLDSTVTPYRRPDTDYASARNQLDQAIQGEQVAVEESRAGVRFQDGPVPTYVPRQPVATLGIEGASARYDLASPVTIPDRSTTMLMFLSRNVPGETSLLFAPDPEVAASSAHPFRVVRFTNETAGVLEPGPVTVVEETSFLGQGVLGTVPAGAAATVRFAVDGDVDVEVKPEREKERTGARLARIANGALEIVRNSTLRTRYRVTNAAPRPAKLVLEHARKPESSLVAPPPGMQQDAAGRIAFIPAEIGPRATAEIVVQEGAPEAEPCDWFSPLAAQVVQAYLRDPHADPDAAKKLASAWTLRDESVRASDERNSLRLQAYGAQSPATRATLERRIATLDKQVAAAEKRFRDAIAGIAVAVSAAP